MRAAIGLGAGFVLAALFAAAGGMGMAAAAGVAAVIAFPAPGVWTRLARPGPALVAALCLVAWASIAQLWSPAGPRQIAMVWLETALGVALVLSAAALSERYRAAPRAIFLTGVLLLSLAMAAEALTGGAVTAIFKSIEAGEPIAPGDPRLRGMLGRGAAAALILAAPAVSMGLMLGGRWRIVAGLTAAAVAVAALGADVAANIAAFIVAAAAFVLALRFPRRALVGIGAAGAGWLTLYPLVILAISPLIEPRRADLPFSWEWRWEAWRAAVELIFQRPFFGWGFDSARHFADLTVEMRGFELSRIPLHTHSGSLQLWLETGLAGVALACAALVLASLRVASGIGAAPAGARAYQAAAAAGTAGAFLAVLAISYGLWQEWLWGTGLLAAAACLLVGRGPAPSKPPA